MEFSESDKTAMLSSLGDTVQIGGVAALGIFSAPGLKVDTSTGTVFTAAASLIVSDTIAAGVIRNDTVITIEGVNYQAFELMPDGAGFVELSLTKDY